MPELAASFFLGVIVTAIVSFIFAYTQLNKYKSKKYLNLQINLQKANLRWNDLEGNLETFMEASQNIELQKAKRSFLLMSFAFVIFSWLGLLFLILIWVSVKKLIKNRLELQLYKSGLDIENLSVLDIGLKLEQIKALGFD